MLHTFNLWVGWGICVSLFLLIVGWLVGQVLKNHSPIDVDMVSPNLTRESRIDLDKAIQKKNFIK